MSDLVNASLSQKPHPAEECADKTVQVTAPVAVPVGLPGVATDQFHNSNPEASTKSEISLKFSLKPLARTLWTHDFFGDVSARDVSQKLFGAQATQTLETVAAVAATPAEALVQGAAQMVVAAEQKVESAGEALLSGAKALIKSTKSAFNGFTDRLKHFKRDGFSFPFKSQKPQLDLNYKTSLPVSFSPPAFAFKGLSYKNDSYFEKALAWSESLDQSALSPVLAAREVLPAENPVPLFSAVVLPEEESAVAFYDSPVTGSALKSSVVSFTPPLIETVTVDVPHAVIAKVDAVPSLDPLPVISAPASSPKSASRVSESRHVAAKSEQTTEKPTAPATSLDAIVTEVVQSQMPLDLAGTKVLDAGDFGSLFEFNPSVVANLTVSDEGGSTRRQVSKNVGVLPQAEIINFDNESPQQVRAIAGYAGNQMEARDPAVKKREEDREISGFEFLPFAMFFAGACDLSDQVQSSPQSHAYNVAHSRDGERFIPSGVLMAMARTLDRRAERDLQADLSDFIDGEANRIEATVVNLSDLGHGHNGSSDQGPDWDLIHTGARLGRQVTRSDSASSKATPSSYRVPRDHVVVV